MTGVVAGTFSSRLEADLAAEYLAGMGIAASVSSDDAGGTLPTLQSAEGASVEVAPEDLERARQLLHDYGLLDPAAKTPLSTRQRIQGIVAGVLFAAFVLFLVIYAALNMSSPE